MSASFWRIVATLIDTIWLFIDLYYIITLRGIESAQNGQFLKHNIEMVPYHFEVFRKLHSLRTIPKKIW